MTCIVSRGALNSTYSLTPEIRQQRINSLRLKLCTSCIFTVNSSAPRPSGDHRWSGWPCKNQKTHLCIVCIFSLLSYGLTPPPPTVKPRLRRRWKIRGAPPPPAIRPPNAAADHQFVGAPLFVTGIPTHCWAHATTSFSSWCLMILLGACLPVICVDKNVVCTRCIGDSHSHSHRHLDGLIRKPQDRALWRVTTEACEEMLLQESSSLFGSE